MIGGGVRLDRISASSRSAVRTSPRRKMGGTLLSVGLAATSALLVGAAAFAEGSQCWD